MWRLCKLSSLDLFFTTEMTFFVITERAKKYQKEVPYQIPGTGAGTDIDSNVNGTQP